MKRFLLSAFFFIFILIGIISGQSTLNKQTLTIKQGLSQNLIYCIYQDHKGFIWFGTKDGLNKYDGYEFKIYSHEPANKFSLSNNNIRAIVEDKKGNFWIGTFGGGLDKFNPVTEKFTTLRNNPNDSTTLSNDFITGLALDQNNNNPVLWISTINGFNRFRINTSTNERFFPDQYLREKAKNKYVRFIVEDKKGRIWIAIANGKFYLFDYKKNHLITPKFEYSTLKPVITFLTINNKGTLFAGSKNGIFYFNDATQSLIKIPGNKKYFIVIKSILNLNNKVFFANAITPGLLYEYNMRNDSLSVFDNISSLFAGTHSGRIISLLKDKSGNMWIGTNGNGIVKKNINEKKFDNYLFNSENKNKLSFASVRAIFEDKEKNIWIGGYGGLDKLNAETGKITTAKFTAAGNRLGEKLPFLSIYKINYAPKNKNILWFSDISSGIIAYNTLNSTYKKIYGSDVYNDKSFYGKNVYDMKYDKNGNLWLNTDKGLSEYVLSTGKYKHYYYFNNRKAFTLGATNDILIDLPRGIWVGTYESGFVLIEPSSNKTIRYVFNPEDTNSVSSNIIMCINKDRKGNLWIGTNGGGLNKFNVKENKFTRFTTKNGLPNNVVYGILEDNNGYLWLSTNKGLSKFDPVKQTFQNYDYDDGLQSNEFNSGAYLKASSGQLFFGGINGVTSFYPSKIKNSKFNPPIDITKFFLLNKPVILSRFLTPNGKLKLRYKDNIFAFQFASLDYSNPMKNKYAYRLKGFQNNWIYNTDAKQRIATFTNIDPGSYTFQVKGTNSDGVWSSKILSLDIEIVPPYWSTLWFKTLIILILVLLIYLFYRRRINFLKVQRTQKEKFTQQLMTSQENERTRIAKELHDAVGQDMLIVKNLSMLALQNKNEKARDNYLNDISEKSQNTINEIRQISMNLRPYLIDRLGLTKAIESMIEDIDNASNIVFRFHSSNIDGCFNSRDEIQIYRIIQESVNNIIKHSKATEAVITLILSNNSIAIKIKDDGVGMQGSAPEKSVEQTFGFGLSGIMERVRILNGKFNIKSSVNSGTNIYITIPIDNEK